MSFSYHIHTFVDSRIQRDSGDSGDSGAGMSGLVNKWIDEQPLIIAVYIVLALSSFGIIVGKMIDFWVYCLRKKMF
ncbi:hypothetical protein [Bacteroides thetaiotaomicron]|uniref:Uncharacterized protein n=1 Tax=Bacteroides thetaiotaomicron TaxID=818 RepID=A0AA46UEH4_BACT4|nr:hypothetical protein [Bacteroides thetaiotaomicron]MCS2242042.1 hypothetical protein [Bacteroides thetaiotaomicron]MCS2908637.1 hypothetical protein [Bacteroides thetaiotaomicron]MDC2095102.1 hypothetical protein [Bacteroides thetaiotaomicron]MDC2115462.1 hypothetical protein [Bacteroides thetaiotaomicron]MDC2119736.1 hypothetical protein [Bacteroides thetaiotaomicron]